jgi:shikimate dehydrogenase
MAATRIPLTARTRVVGVIGDPIEHSLSPLMHNAAFRALGLSWAYLAFRVPPPEVAAAVRAVRALGLAGLNVTIPHKEAVLQHVDRLSARAQICRAVNTIVHRKGRLIGDNTDVLGLERDWSELGVPSRMSQAVVVGAGGSARAAIVALGPRARRVVIAARRPERARLLVRQLGRHVRAELVAAHLDELDPRTSHAGSWLSDARLVVNATPLGMHDETFAPLAYGATPSECLFYDLVYTKQATPFLKAARKARRRGANGLGMLLHQGAAAFALWTGIEPPLDVMRRALRSSA